MAVWPRAVGKSQIADSRYPVCDLLSTICYLSFCGQPTSMFQLFLSSSAPSEIVSRLQEFVDPEEIDPYKPSLYRGERSIVGRVEGHDFHFRKRLKGPWYWTVLTPAFWFKPALHGTVSPKRNGSEVLVEGGASLAAKVANSFPASALPTVSSSAKRAMWLGSPLG